MKDEKIFADGFSFKRNENAPDFVIGRLSIKLDDAISFLKGNEKNGWVNLNIKTARSGNHYIELDTFEPKSRGGEFDKNVNNSTKKVAKPKKQEVDDDGGLPF